MLCTSLSASPSPTHSAEVIVVLVDSLRCCCSRRLFHDFLQTPCGRWWLVGLWGSPLWRPSPEAMRIVVELASTPLSMAAGQISWGGTSKKQRPTS